MCGILYSLLFWIHQTQTTFFCGPGKVIGPLFVSTGKIITSTGNHFATVNESHAVMTDDVILHVLPAVNCLQTIRWEKQSKTDKIFRTDRIADTTSWYSVMSSFSAARSSTSTPSSRLDSVMCSSTSSIFSRSSESISVIFSSANIKHKLHDPSLSYNKNNKYYDLSLLYNKTKKLEKIKLLHLPTAEIIVDT